MDRENHHVWVLCIQGSQGGLPKKVVLGEWCPENQQEPQEITKVRGIHGKPRVPAHCVGHSSPIIQVIHDL